MNNSYLLKQEDYGIATICMYLGWLGFFVFLLICAVSLGRGERSAVPLSLTLLVANARFLVEWNRFRKSRQAALLEDRLNFYDANSGVQKIPLECIRDVGSCSAIFVVRRFFGSLSRGAAFIKVTLADGSVLYTLAEQATFEFPPGKRAIEEIKIAIHNRKCSLAAANA